MLKSILRKKGFTLVYGSRGLDCNGGGRHGVVARAGGSHFISTHEGREEGARGRAYAWKCGKAVDPQILPASVMYAPLLPPSKAVPPKVIVSSTNSGASDQTHQPVK